VLRMKGVLAWEISDDGRSIGVGYRLARDVLGQWPRGPMIMSKYLYAFFNLP
jgi:hypothetical protein